MKRMFRYYFIVWAVFFILFHVIAFSFGGWASQEKYTPSFWIGYVFITVTFIGQLACAYFALKGDDIKRFFYKISLITTSYIGLILSFVFGGLCMVILPLPYWVGIILCSIVLAFNVASVTSAAAAIEIVSDVDDKVRTQTFFIKSLTVDAEGLVGKAKSEAVRAECKRVYEAVRYSDPMSDDDLDSIEEGITDKFADFTKVVEEDRVEEAARLAGEMIILLGDRNKKCKFLK